MATTAAALVCVWLVAGPLASDSGNGDRGGQGRTLLRPWQVGRALSKRVLFLIAWERSEVGWDGWVCDAARGVRELGSFRFAQLSLHRSRELLTPVVLVWHNA